MTAILTRFPCQKSDKMSDDTFHIEVTYREIVNSSRPQFENPISIPLNIPTGATATM